MKLDSALIATITQVIGSLGFPIACCIYLFWSSNKERESHKEEMQNCTQAINNNTNALIALSERLAK